MKIACKRKEHFHGGASNISRQTSATASRSLKTVSPLPLLHPHAQEERGRCGRNLTAPSPAPPLYRVSRRPPGCARITHRSPSRIFGSIDRPLARTTNIFASSFPASSTLTQPSHSTGFRPFRWHLTRLARRAERRRTAEKVFLRYRRTRKSSA